MAEQKEKVRVVFSFGYVNFDGMVIPGYYVGFIGDKGNNEGNFAGLDRLIEACADAAAASKEFSVAIDMGFEGLVRTDRGFLLLQPIQENPRDYKSIEELMRIYSGK